MKRSRSLSEDSICLVLFSQAFLPRSLAAKWGLIACLICALAGNTSTVFAQTAHPSQFCYQKGADSHSVPYTEVCSDTLKDAEISMRNDTVFTGSGQFLERFDPPGAFAAVSRSYPVAQFWYKVKDRLPVTSYVMYAASLGGTAGSGGFGCTPRAQDPDAAYADWCDSETNMLAAAQQRLLATDLAGCTLIGTTLIVDNANQAPMDVARDSSNPQRGLIRTGNGYGIQYRTYQTQANCPSPSPGVRFVNWYMQRERTFLCQSGFDAGTWAGTAPADGTYCVTVHSVSSQLPVTLSLITGPVKQCASCAGSPNPIYPATGDKARQEPDFEFAGRTFVRYYHSLGQLRNDPAFAVNWTHTYSDRVVGNPYGQTVVVFDDQGYLETFTSIGNSRFRAENSVDRFLEAVSGGSVAWRLRMSNGETREFDANGFLVAIRGPDNPANDVSMTYDANGLLLSVTDLQGRKLSFIYIAKMLSQIVKPDGTTVSFSYDSDLNLTSVDYGSGNGIRRYVYHEAGYVDPKFSNHLTSIVDEAGETIGRFSYDSQGRATTSRMLGTPNEVSTASYPTSAQATMVTASGATRQYTMDNDLYRHVTATSDPSGSTGAAYDSATGRVTSRTDASGTATNYEYDATYGYRSAIVEAVGKPEQRRTEFVRDITFNRPTERRVRDAIATLKAKTNWTYNSRGQVSTIVLTDPSVTPNATRTTQFTYCEQVDLTAGTCPFLGLLKSVDGPRIDVNDVVTYTYRLADEPSCAAWPTTCPYRKGDLWKIVNAAAQTFEIAKLDAAGRPLQIKDPNGLVTDFEYSALGWLTAKKVRGTNDASEADDQITRVEYWPTGQVKRVTQPTGAIVNYAYDVAHRLNKVTDNYANGPVYTLDAAGHRVGEDIGGVMAGLVLVGKLSRTFDPLGRMQTLTDAYNHSTTFTYDANGNPDKITDPLLRVEDDDYDPLNRLSRTLHDMNGISAETTFGYDVLDNLVQVRDPKLLNTTYIYNGFSDLKQVVSPDTGTTSYTYDGAGNRASQTDARSKVANYSYDALNRLTQITFPGAPTLNITYTWDVTQADCQSGETSTLGHLAKVMDGSGSTVYCYDRFGHVVRKVQTTNGVALTLRYIWDTAGRLASTIYPDGAVVDYTYVYGDVDEIGAKTTTGTRQVLFRAYHYYPFGPLSQWQVGANASGVSRVMSHTLNLNYQPGIAQDSEPDGLSVGYEFDEVGNLKKLRDGNQLDPPQRIYVYDGLNRLLQTQNGSTQAVLQAYSYDKTGNRTSATVSGATTTYTYPSTSHRLSQVGTSTRNYDQNGNTTSYPSGTVTKGFVYGDHNRMTQYKEGTTVKMNYVYNGRGEQVRKYLGTTNTYAMYDESGNWIGGYGNAGASAATQQVIWFQGMPIGIFVGAGASQQLFFVESDSLGTPRMVIDPSRGASGTGTVVWKWNPNGEAFGNTAPIQDPDGDGTQFVFDLRFPGQRYDNVSGLNYNYFRDYDPNTGRYVESDPLGQGAGVGTYGYASLNPLSKIDPDGRFEVRAIQMNSSGEFKYQFTFAYSCTTEIIKRNKNQAVKLLEGWWGKLAGWTSNGKNEGDKLGPQPVGTSELHESAPGFCECVGMDSDFESIFENLFPNRDYDYLSLEDASRFLNQVNNYLINQIGACDGDACKAPFRRVRDFYFSEDILQRARNRTDPFSGIRTGVRP